MPIARGLLNASAVAGLIDWNKYKLEQRNCEAAQMGNSETNNSGMLTGALYTQQLKQQRIRTSWGKLTRAEQSVLTGARSFRLRGYLAGWAPPPCLF